jgi:hypothetical protein
MTGTFVGLDHGGYWLEALTVGAFSRALPMNFPNHFLTFSKKSGNDSKEMREPSGLCGLFMTYLQSQI